MTASRRYPLLRVMMVGSLPPPLGGTTVSFHALCEFVARHAGQCIVIDSAPRGRGIARAGMRTIVAVIRHLAQADIVTMHFSDRASITIAPILSLICRVAGKPYVLRQFGGEFDRTIAGLAPWHRWILGQTLFRADAVLLQTKAMMRSFAPLSRRLHWFPTARQQPGCLNRLSYAHGQRPVLKCLFVGHVSRAKGALAAAEAASEFVDAELSLYGPLVDLAQSELDRSNVKYRGVLPAERVSEIMAEHDVLLFPTTHPGEGYSGTLVEAAMVGLPIIANRWQSLPEMFSDDEIMFIDEATAAALSAQMRKIMANPAALQERASRLLARASDFDAETVFGQFLDLCYHATGGGA